MNSEIILYILASILIVDFATEFILSYLNLIHQKGELPELLKSIYDNEKYNKSQEYLKVNTKFGFLTSSFSFLLTLSVLLFGYLGWLDIFVKLSFETPLIQSLVFFAILFITSDLLSMPFSYYKTFKIEEHFGFNKQTIKLFVMDKIKGYLIALLLGGIILSLLLWLIQTLGQNFWIWFWVAISLFLIVVNLFYTSIVLPLFNKLVPLEAGSLRSEIEAYSKKVNFPLANIFVMDGSKRSAKSNAFFSGFGRNKKIVLFDTLIKNHTEEELVAVLAHEAGHYKKNHIVQGMIISIIQTGIILYLSSLFIFNREFSFALGGGENAIHLNLIAFFMLLSPLTHIIGILSNVWSRKNEYEADNYAASTYNGEALKSALKKLSADNLSNLTPHPAMVFVHYSHPPLLDRLKALK